MSKLQELIQELCPDGVEYKTLGDIATDIYRGSGIKRDQIIEVGTPCVRYGEIYTTYGVWFDKCVSHTNEAEIPNRKFFEHGDILFAITGERIEDIAKSCAYVGYEKCLAGGDIVVLKHNENPKYLAYALSSSDVQIQKSKGKVKSKVVHSSVPAIKALMIPVPPLPVQSEIVHILDNFLELTAELTARKKQYEFYRDELLKPKADIPIVTLKEIATYIYRGSGIKRDQVTDKGIPCVRYGEIYTTYNTWFDKCVSHTQLEYVSNPKYFEYGDILFAITGESVEEIAKSIAYIGHDKCLAGGDIVVLKHKQNPRYLAHILATQQAREQKSKGKVKSKVVHSNVPSIEQIRIPLPSLDIQERYADVLDNFEQICNDLDIGLPAEIEARKKQYEFYRDALLTYAATGEIIVKQAEYDALIKLCQYVFGVVFVKLGDLFTTRNVYTPSKSNKEYWNNSDIPWFRMEDIRENGRILDSALQSVSKLAVKGDVLSKNSIIISTSATIGEHALITCPFLANQRFTCLMLKDVWENQCNITYLFYYCYRLGEFCCEHLNQGNFASVDMTQFNNFIFAVPPLEEQQCIVSILDRFDTLCNNIVVGLPAEIEARRKQYEYYRDSLLTFQQIGY